jgi:hypothetical protein
MRVLILTDADFARREHSLLARLEIGLADEGARVIHALPSSGSDPAPSAAADLMAPPAGDASGSASGQDPFSGGSGLYSTLVAYEDVGFAFSVPARARRLILAIAAALDEPEDDLALDVIHVFGHQAWPLALALARYLDARVVFEVWSASLLHEASRIPPLHPAGRAPQLPALMVPGRALGEAMGKHAPLSAIHVAPWGVPVPEAVRRAREPGDHAAVAASVLASGDDPHAVIAALDGLRSAAERFPELLVFLDSRAAHRAQIWRRVRKLGLMDRLSVVGDVESRREPILHTDLLIQPEARGHHRSLTLAAMAAGMAVVAHADGMIDSFLDRRTARLVSGTNAGAWSEALHQLLADPAGCHQLGASARQHIHDHHSVSAYVTAVLTAYESLLAPVPRVTA